MLKAIEKSNDKAYNRPAVVVRNVTKEFVIPHEKRTTLFENIKGFFKPASYEKFVALKDINFTVERGDSIGIIGDNGSGKSTLLKIIAGILKPTSGSVEVNGKITPFLELGVGFQMDLTAKENIEVYSTIMGLSDKEIARNMDSVLEFAGLTKFRDTKLKNFSSGMQVRLAFATAIQTTPDILLVDEVLAVGDMDFQQKCLDIFSEYRRKGVTIIFVSHDLNSVRRFCNKTLLLKQGKLLDHGKTDEIIDSYVYGIDPAQGSSISENSSNVSSSIDTATNNGRWGNQKITITNVTLLDKYANENSRFNTGDPLTIRIYFHASEPVVDPVFGIAIYNENDLLCYGTNTDIENISMGTVSGDNFLDVHIPAIHFISGKFLITVATHTKDHIPYDWHDKKYSFTVVNTSQISGLFDMKSKWVFKP